uniref:Uncharacterized protein n=1 Tax=Romanomermis culicivorax TaxID=13658 RepID=A0A915K8W1_ROMCU
MIAMDQQEAGWVNPNPDADELPPQNMKRSLPKVKLAGPKRDLIMPKIQPNLEEMDPKIERQLERIPQDHERFQLAMQLRELKGTVEALFNIIANATIGNNKREADSCRQEPDRQ